METTYSVKVGDVFGGYWTAGTNLTLEDAKKLEQEEIAVADYFTTTYIEDSNGMKIILGMKIL